MISYHHSASAIRAAYLAVQNGSQSQKLGDNLAVDIVHQAWVMSSFVRTNPADVTHGRVNALNMELVLQTDREPVKGAHRRAVRGEILVQLPRPVQSLVKEDLVETVVLTVISSRNKGVVKLIAYDLMRDCCRLAERARDLHCAVLSFAYLRHKGDTALADDGNLVDGEELLDEGAG